MNILYWYSCVILYYHVPAEDAWRLFPAFVNDIFGLCVKGIGPICTEWVWW